MRSLIFSNLTTRKPAIDVAGGSLTLPVLVAGQQWTTALRFTERVEGTYGEVFPAIHSLRASIGLVDARPITSTWKLQVGSGASTGANTTPPLDREIAPSDLAKALNDLSGITPHDFSVESDNGSYIVRRATGAQFVLQVRANRLRPVSFVRLREFQQDGEYAFDVRLVRAPLAFTDSAEPVLPAEPYIVTVVDGNTDASGTYFVNEVQNLILPPDFRGVYYLRRGLLRTSLLSTDDGAEEIQAALDAMLEPEGGTVAVTNPQTGTARIEFQGDLKGVDLDPLTVQVAVEGTPPGDWTFTLDLNRSEMWAALRETETVKAVYEVEANVYIDAEDHDAGTRTVKLWKEPVQVTRPVQFEGLAAAQNIDWLRPPSPKTYVPFTLSQVLTGQQQAFTAVIGDGAATSFTLDHNFASEVCQVIVCENSRPGRVLRDNEYTLELEDDNSLTVAGFATTPTLNQYAVLVVAVGPESVFQSHTHTIEQVLTLQDILDDLTGRVVDLEAILPSIGPAAAASQASGIEIALPEIRDVLFFKGNSSATREADLKEIFGDDGLDLAKLPRTAPYMLPAVHDGTSASYTTGSLPAYAADSVWSNDSAAVLDMGRGIYGGKVKVGGFFGSDGRVRFAVTRQGTTKSYYPTGFERELWRIFINEKMLRVNRTLDVQFGLGLQIANGSSNAQWLLVIEKGTAPQQTTPSTTGTNLENVVWDATPILSQRLILTQNRQTHSFGTRIKRALVSSVDTITCDTLLYGVWEGANSAAPSGANFALRARMVQFDTENAVGTDARGWIALEVLGADKEGKPKAVIS
jgi:hypothetical protein